MKRPEVERDTCYLCGDPHKEILQQHHIVPQRYGGPDKDSNLVELCPTCHRKIERLYNVVFYDYMESYYYQEFGIDNATAETETNAAVTDGGSTTSAELSYSRLSIESVEDYNPSEWRNVKEAVAVIEDSVNHDRGAPEETVISEYNAPDDAVKEEIEKLKTKGEVYEPKEDHLRPT